MMPCIVVSNHASSVVSRCGDKVPRVSKKSAPRRSPKPSLSLWLVAGDRKLPWGVADAADATEVVNIDGLWGPNRITVTHSGSLGLPSLRLDLRVVDGVPLCHEVTISSVDDGRGVRPSDILAISVEHWVAATFTALAFTGFEGGKGWNRTWRLGSPPLAGVFEQITKAQRQKGTRTLTNARIKRAADIYRAKFHTRAPVAAVAAVLGVENRTASSYIHRARELGYLPPVERRGQKKI
jgi:hypothetical protein